MSSGYLEALAVYKVFKTSEWVEKDMEWNQQEMEWVEKEMCLTIVKIPQGEGDPDFSCH